MPGTTLFMLIGIAALSTVLACSERADAQTFSNADIAADLPVYAGRQSPLSYNGVSDLWSATSYTVSISGPIMTITTTTGDYQESRASQQICFTLQTQTAYTFDTRYMSANASVINAGANGVADWRVDLPAKSNGSYVRQTNTFFDPTCGSGAKVSAPYWGTNHTIDILAISEDAANALQAIISSAWKGQ